MNGVTEARAHEIATEVFSQQISELSEEAQVVGAERAAQLDELVIANLVSIGALGTIADPSVQVLLRKAQLSAASSERESDYDLLARLIEDRVVRGDARPVRAGIEQAVQVVDKLDDAALVGLTAAVATMQFHPMAGRVSQGLATLDRLFGLLITSDLPTGEEWLDHLDVLGAIRVIHLGGAKPFAEVYSDKLKGYLSYGIESGSNECASALAQLRAAGLPEMVIDHELKPGFARVAAASGASLEEVLSGRADLDVQQRKLACNIARDVFRLDEVDPGCVEALISKLQDYPHLTSLRDWWGTLTAGFQVTAVGKVLARANAKRCDTEGMLPALDQLATTCLRTTRSTPS